MGSRTERLEEEDDGEVKNVKRISSRKSPVAILVDDFQKQKKRNSQTSFIFSSL